MIDYINYNEWEYLMKYHCNLIYEYGMEYYSYIENTNLKTSFTFMPSTCNYSVSYIELGYRQNKDIFCYWNLSIVLKNTLLKYRRKKKLNQIRNYDY